MHIAIPALRAATLRILAAMGCEPGEADIVATHLIEANLRGHDSHGVGMLPTYIRNFRAGKLHANRHAKCIRQDGSMAAFDGQMGFGQVVAREATDWAIGQALQSGLAVITLSRSQHIGRVGTYAEQACNAGLVAISFVNAISGPPRVAPFGGSDGRMSTEPVCIGVPTGDPAAPVILDFATSQVALGKMRVAYNEGRTVHDGLLIDAEGCPTNQPSTLYNEPKGAVLPFGAHKGSGLALICGFLGGALSGAGTQHAETSRELGSTNGMTSFLLDPGRLIDIAWFRHEVDALIAWVKASPPLDPATSVLVAGEPERAARSARLRDGLLIDETSWGEILAGAEALGVTASVLTAD